MPYKLRKAPNRELYWVITIETGKKHSKLPIPLDKAKAQMRILETALKGGNLREQRDFLVTRADRLRDQIRNYNQLNRDTTELRFQLYNILQRIQAITTQLAGEDEDPQGHPPTGEDASEDPSGLGKRRKLKGGVTAEQLKSIKKDFERIFPALQERYGLNLTTGKITYNVEPSKGTFALLDAALQHWITPSEYTQIKKSPEYKNFRDFALVTDFIDSIGLAQRIAGTEHFDVFEDNNNYLLDLFRQLNLAPLGSRERDLLEEKIFILYEKFRGKIISIAWKRVEQLLMGPGVKLVESPNHDYTYVSSPATGRREFLPYPAKKGRGKKINGGMIPVRNPMLVLAAEKKAKESIKLELDQSNAAIGFANGNYSMEEILQLAIKSLTRKGEAEAVAYINRLIQEHSGNPNFKVKRPEARNEMEKVMGFKAGGKRGAGHTDELKAAFREHLRTANPQQHADLITIFDAALARLKSLPPAHPFLKRIRGEPINLGRDATKRLYLRQAIFDMNQVMGLGPRDDEEFVVTIPPNLNPAPADKDFNKECPICMEEVTTNRHRTPCGHVFHQQCFNQIRPIDPVTGLRACPVCRKGSGRKCRKCDKFKV